METVEEEEKFRRLFMQNTFILCNKNKFVNFLCKEGEMVDGLGEIMI